MISGFRFLQRTVLAIAGFGVIVWLLFYVRNDLVLLTTTFDWYIFTAATFMGVFLTVFYGHLFGLLVCKHGAQVSVSTLISVYLISQPGKYVPGKIWPTIIQSVALGGRSFLIVAGASNMELMLLAILHMTTLGLVCLLALYSWPLALLMGLFGAILSAIFLWLPTHKLIEFLPDRIFREYRLVSTPSVLPYYKRYRTVVLSGACLLVNLIASWVMLASAGSIISIDDRLAILSALYLGFALSFLALPIPAGLGVREMAAVGAGLLVAPEVSASDLVFAALLARVWQIITDMISMIIGAIMLSIKNQNAFP